MNQSPDLNAVTDECRIFSEWKFPGLFQNLNAINHRKEQSRRSPGPATAAALDAVMQ